MRLLSILILLFTLSCKSGQERNVIDPVNVPNKLSVFSYVGWGVNPSFVEKGELPLGPAEKDWFYMVVPGKAIPRSIELNSPTYMQSSCKLSAMKENQKKLYQDAVLSANAKWKGAPDLEKKSFDLLSKEKTEALVCKPTGDMGANYKSCECLIYVMFKGGKEELAKKVIN